MSSPASRRRSYGRPPASAAHARPHVTARTPSRPRPAPRRTPPTARAPSTRPPAAARPAPLPVARRATRCFLRGPPYEAARRASNTSVGGGASAAEGGLPHRSTPGISAGRHPLRHVSSAPEPSVGGCGARRFSPHRMQVGRPDDVSLPQEGHFTISPCSWSSPDHQCAEIRRRVVGHLALNTTAIRTRFGDAPITPAGSLPSLGRRTWWGRRRGGPGTRRRRGCGRGAGLPPYGRCGRGPGRRPRCPG